MAVYFIECAGFVKIGFAEDVARRLAALQVGNPLPLNLMGAVDGEAREEAEFHDRFRALHVRGEWFALTHELRTYVESVLRSAPKPAAPRLVSNSAAVEFAARLVEARESKFLSQVALAALIGASPATIYRIERGERPSPRIEAALRKWSHVRLPVVERDERAA